MGGAGQPVAHSEGERVPGRIREHRDHRGQAQLVGKAQGRALEVRDAQAESPENGLSNDGSES